MSDRPDPVERALQSLGGRQWPHDAGHAELEQNLMQSFETQTHRSFFARHRVVIPIVAILVMAIGGFAMAGGVRLIQSWLATVAVNGQVVHTGEVVPDENGQATITLPEGSLRDGENQVSVTLDGQTPAGSETVTVTVTGEKNGVVISTQPQSDTGAKQKKE